MRGGVCTFIIIVLLLSALIITLLHVGSKLKDIYHALLQIMDNTRDTVNHLHYEKSFPTSVHIVGSDMVIPVEIADVPVDERGYYVPSINEETSEVPEEDIIDEQALTENEVARIQRETDFDARIKKMKDELASRTPDAPRKGSEALQLHPHVHNLPHTIIADFYDDLPDVEISQ